MGRQYALYRSGFKGLNYGYPVHRKVHFVQVTKEPVYECLFLIDCPISINMPDGVKDLLNPLFHDKP